MPQVSNADCLPILAHKVHRLVALVDAQSGDVNAATRDALWRAIADVCEQMRNVGGAPVPDIAAAVRSAITPES